MSNSDSGSDPNAQILASSNTLLSLQKVLEETDLNHITSSLFEMLIKELQEIQTVFHQLRERTQEQYLKQRIKSIQVLVQDIIHELQIAIYILSQRDELEITQRVESMRLVYKSIRSCSLYIEEILDMLSSYPS